MFCQINGIEVVSDVLMDKDTHSKFGSYVSKKIALHACTQDKHCRGSYTISCGFISCIYFM